MSIIVSTLTRELMYCPWAFSHNEALSFQIATDDQEETIAIGTPSSAMAGRKARAAGAKTSGAFPGKRVLTEALAASGDEAKRAFGAMMGMKKIDVAAIKAARLTLRPHASSRSA